MTIKLYIVNAKGVNSMKALELNLQIKAAAAVAGLSLAEVARRVGMSPQAFNNRIKTGKFSRAEFDAIAAAMGAEYKAVFIFPDGREV